MSDAIEQSTETDGLKTGLHAGSLTSRLSTHLGDMRNIFIAMVSFGIAIGLIFPFFADPFVTWDAGEKIYFRAICLVAGFAVGTLCYFLVKITIYRNNLLLARQKAAWEASFDSLAEGVALLDAQGAVTRVNGAFEEMVGADETALRGKKLAEVMAERCGKQKGGCLITKAMYTGDSQNGESSMAGKVCTQSANPILEEDGDVAGCVFVLRDVTEKRKLHQQLIQSARMAAVNHLVSGTAHEINNPLMGVTGVSELILAREDIDERLRGDVELILAEARRASGITKHLLAYVSSSEDRFIDIDVNDLLREAIGLKEYNLKLNQVVVSAELHPQVLLVNTEPDQLKQVFFNLIDNSEQALAEIDGRRRLNIKTETMDSVVRVHVIDNGPGVPAGTRENIFDPFFTTREVGEGTGLGLTMSYGIVGDLDGRLWLEDSDGGAHFIIELPLAADMA